MTDKDQIQDQTSEEDRTASADFSSARNEKNHRMILQMVYSAMFLALALLLPFLTGQIPQIGQLLSPMHLPVLLCGFVCGWPWGMAVGFAAPLLRMAIFGMPPAGAAIPMAFELAVYGLCAGLFFRVFRKLNIFADIYISLILSMLAGRVVGALVKYVMSGFDRTSLSFAAFWASYFVGTFPGIILQLAVIPPIVYAMRKTGQFPNDIS